MTRSTKTPTNSKSVWKRREGWVQFHPHKSHPSYDEWMKLKEKERENDKHGDDSK